MKKNKQMIRLQRITWRVHDLSEYQQKVYLTFSEIKKKRLPWKFRDAYTNSTYVSTVETTTTNQKKLSKITNNRKNNNQNNNKHTSWFMGDRDGIRNVFI